MPTPRRPPAGALPATARGAAISFFSTPASTCRPRRRREGGGSCAGASAPRRGAPARGSGAHRAQRSRARRPGRRSRGSAALAGLEQASKPTSSGRRRVGRGLELERPSDRHPVRGRAARIRWSARRTARSDAAAGGRADRRARTISTSRWPRASPTSTGRRGGAGSRPRFRRGGPRSSEAAAAPPAGLPLIEAAPTRPEADRRAGGARGPDRRRSGESRSAPRAGRPAAARRRPARAAEELRLSLQGTRAREDWAGASGIADRLVALEPDAIHHHQKRVELAFRTGERAPLLDAYLALGDALGPGRRHGQGARGVRPGAGARPRPTRAPRPRSPR